MPPKVAPGTGSQCRAPHVPPAREDQLGVPRGLEPAVRPPGGQDWHQPLPSVLAALGGPWLVTIVAAGASRCSLQRCGLPCCPCPPPPPTIPRPSTRTRGWCLGRAQPAAWLPSLGRPPPGGHHRQQRQRRQSRRGPQPCLNLQAGDGGAAWSGVPRISKGMSVYACVCLCLIFRTLRSKVLVSYLKFRLALQK